MYCKTWLRSSTYCAVVLATPVAATAAPVTFGFTGVVTEVGATLAVEFSVNEPIVGKYTFESTTADSSPGDPVFGVYINAITTFTATFGGNYTVTHGLDNNIYVGEGPLSNDFIWVDVTNPTSAPVAGLNLFALFIRLADSDSTVFASDALPLTPPDLSEFDIDVSVMLFSEPGKANTVDFRVTSLTFIPEPSTLTLAALAVLGLLAHRCRRT